MKNVRDQILFAIETSPGSRDRVLTVFGRGPGGRRNSSTIELPAIVALDLAAQLIYNRPKKVRWTKLRTRQRTTVRCRTKSG